MDSFTARPSAAAAAAILATTFFLLSAPPAGASLGSDVVDKVKEAHSLASDEFTTGLDTPHTGPPARWEKLRVAPSSPWGSPLSGHIVLQRSFEKPAFRYGPGHRGIDISGEGKEVRAVDHGVVRFAGVVAGKPVVSIEHTNGLISTYEPVLAEVSRGQSVSRGMRIGTLEHPSAHAHCPKGCLHLGARRGDSYLDPQPLLEGARPSVLYPIQ